MNELTELKEKLSNYSVLFVDDEIDVQQGTCIILTKFFDTVDVANDGLEGLEAFKKNNYDIVITDIKMPYMNGIEMIEEIKKIKPEVCVIFVSADRDNDHFLSKDSQMYFTKPITYDDIIKMMKQIIDCI